MTARRWLPTRDEWVDLGFLLTLSVLALVGLAPTLPAANCAFCSLTAATTSAGVSFSCASRSGLSQIRIA